ncbi:hypothetical protein CVU76_01525 [Candidatus Dojkabacteria bacterium HGW-Dojkabacteria-1]|uniref:ATP-grasp domain-containing protein n=1 Tax=Candidatus Dojkabacteria bacterium HGW-Dojkabacteria-1 TaxID=2013761 RepID=A0A2N2F3F8_9BACT|nr:MAG: hypothetical protein CVU76_01525 [Candidatus Dojkabacteria bacterium HGW-Dojkabacteria-1]
MSAILVVTTLPDPHVEMVKKHLSSDANVVIFDPKTLALSGGFTLSDAGLLSTLDGVNPTSIWYRKPKYVSDAELEKMGIPKDLISAISSLHEEGFSLISEAYPESLWVSKPTAIKSASNKLLQTLIAKKIGFRVPETIFSTDPVAIEGLRSRVGDIVIKPLGRPFATVNGIPSWFFATVIPSSQTMDYEGLGLTPMIFQQLIHKLFDLRVTIIGNKIFGCKIVSDQVDWRTVQSKPDTLYTPFELDRNIIEKCLLMNQQLGLNFGAYDFAYSKEGEYVFLEINPNGQWGFVEDKTGLPLSKTMAELLTGSL